LKREIEQPNLWSEYAKFDFSYDIEKVEKITNDKFSPDQIKQIFEVINEIRSSIKQMDFVKDDQLSIINRKLDYLIDASSHQGKFDWLHIARSIVLEIVFYFIHNPVQANSIFIAVKSIFTSSIKYLCH